MAATRISDLPAATSVANNDLIPIVADPLGAPTTKKITYNSFFANVVVTAKFSNTVTFTQNVVSSNNFTANNLFVTWNVTPSTSTDSVSQGKIWYDSNYIYVAVANNSIKRAALSSF